MGNKFQAPNRIDNFEARNPELRNGKTDIFSAPRVYAVSDCSFAAEAQRSQIREDGGQAYYFPFS